MTVQVSATGTFAAALPSGHLTGRWLVGSGLIVTAVSVGSVSPAPPTSAC